jgi:hypothetical protein|tara:strand:- start:644 stop:820 length:177 start_codon:yes stop_codon:yes gene_type:complete
MTAKEIRNMTDSEIKEAWKIINKSCDNHENYEDETISQRRHREWYQDTIYYEFNKRSK